MAKKVKNNLKIIVRVIVLYGLSCLVIASITTVLSITAAIHSQFVVSKVSSIVARGALFPYLQLSKHTNSTFFLAWEKGLLLLEATPHFINQAKSLQVVYVNHTKIDSNFISSLAEEYSHFLHDWATFQQLVNQSKLATLLLAHTQYPLLKQQINQNAQLLQAGDSFLHFVAQQLAENKPVNFLLLFQNNMELRPTGGFPGSYATLHLAQGEPIEFEVQDIYVPDGQLQGHVDPPLPIEEAFQQGFWKLRDANWHPDFHESAERIKWFFSNAGYPYFDGVMAVNFTPTQDLLKIVGPVQVADLNETITADNMYQILQRTDDKNFFAGSTKKKDTLSAFAIQLIFKLQHLKPSQYLDISQLITQELKEKNILISIDDPNLASFATLNHWDGKLSSVDCSNQGCAQDYFSVFEANLGVNKSNCCVKRNLTLVKESDQSNLTTTTTIRYQNEGPGSQFAEVAGDYKTFIRLYYPINTQLFPPVIDGKSYTEYIRKMKAQGYFHPITSDGYSWGEVNGLKELGMWIEVPTNSELILQIKTKNVISTKQRYSIVVQKQPGTLDKFNNLKVSLNERTLYSDVFLNDLTLQ